MTVQKGAYHTGTYRNVFAEYGYSEADIQNKVEQTFQELFFGDEDTRIYYDSRR